MAKRWLELTTSRSGAARSVRHERESPAALRALVPLALVRLAPVVLNIVAFHAFLAPSGLGLANVLLALTLYLAWVNRRAYPPLAPTRVL
jgi:hypothetical protein